MESSGGDYYGKQFPQTQRISHICDKLIHSDMYGVKDFPSRHNLPMQGLPHLLDKSFPSDIYSKEFSPRSGFQLPSLTPAPIHDKTFHSAMVNYGKEFSPSIPGLQTSKLTSNLLENGSMSADKQFLHQQGQAQALQSQKMGTSFEKAYPGAHKHYSLNQSLQSTQLATSMADKTAFNVHSSVTSSSGLGASATSSSSSISNENNSMVADKHHLLQQSHSMLMQKINNPVHKPFHNPTLSSKSYSQCSSPNQIIHSSQLHLKQTLPNMIDKSYHSNNTASNNSNNNNNDDNDNDIINASDIINTQTANLYSHNTSMQSQKLQNPGIDKAYHENFSISSKQYLQIHNAISAQKMSRINDKGFLNGNTMQGRELLSPNPEQLRSSSVVNMVEKRYPQTTTREKIPSGQLHYQPYVPQSPTGIGYHTQNNLVKKPMQPQSPLQSPLPTMQSPAPPPSLQSQTPPLITQSSSPLQSTPQSLPPPQMRSPMPLQSPPPPLQSPSPSQPSPSSIQAPSPQQQSSQYNRPLSSESYQHSPVMIASQITSQHHLENALHDAQMETSCSYLETPPHLKMPPKLSDNSPELNDKVSDKQISPLQMGPLAQNPDNLLNEQVSSSQLSAENALCSSTASLSASVTTSTAFPSELAVTTVSSSGAAENRYHCEFCGKHFAQRYVLQMHRRTHTGEKPFQCDFCIQRFARKDTLKIHRRIHTGETPFQCDICPKQFAQASKLLKHKKRCHLMVKKKPNANDAKSSEVILLNAEETKDLLPTQIELKTEADTDSEILPQMQPQKAETSNPPKRKNLVTCDICLKQFAHRDYLTVHKRSHTGERPFRCDFCPQRFTRRDMLRVHRRTHTGEKPFECTICLKRFAQRDKLHIHTRVHTGEKPYKCQICSKQFSQRNTLVGHLRSHSGERPYQCEICLRRFAQKDYLRVHTRSHTGERPYECDFCIQKFSRRDTLIVHRRIHTGEKPFRCEICGKQFAQTDKLRRHRRTHPEFKQGLVTTTAFNKKLNIVKSEVEDTDIKPETNKDSSSNVTEGSVNNEEEDSKSMLVPVKSLEDYTPVNNYLWLL